MFLTLQVLTAVVVAVAMALSLAHALELPGKMRLQKDQYLSLQPIYYPGFTFGGAAEPVGLLLLIGLLAATPFGTVEFWLISGSLIALLAMHGAYWLLTHPVNNFWLEEVEISAGGSGFFRADPFGRNRMTNAFDWRALRDRWEYSHVVRLVFGLTSFVFLVIALALD